MAKIPVWITLLAVTAFVQTASSTRTVEEAKALVAKFDDDKLQDTLDDIIQDLEDKYGTFDPSDFWHPYVFGTGNENREILHVRNVEQVQVAGNFIQWKYARLGLKHYLIGLKEREINVLGLDFLPVASIALDQDLEAFTVVTKWNEKENHAEMIILSVSSEPRLHVHLFEKDNIQAITSFPLHYAVKAIESCHVGLSSKVVLIPKDSKMDIDIYNVEVHNNTQVWFFQRLAAKNNSNVVVYDSDTLESIIALSGDNQLYIHSFDSKAGMFAVSQNIALPHSCKSLFSFTVAYQHYIGCVPLDPNYTVRFVSYNYNTNEYILEDEDASFRDNKATSVYPIAVPDYTDQYFILVRDVNALTRIMVYHGRQSGFQVEYDCTIKNNNSCPNVADLSRGVGFRHRDYSGFIFPSGEEDYQEGGNSIVWLITKEIRDTRSPLLDESRQLYNNYNELSKRFQEWEQSVAAIEKVLNNSIKIDEPNVFTGSWDVEKITTTNLLGDGRHSKLETVVNQVRFVGSEWREQDFDTDMKHVYSQLNYLKRDASIAKSELTNAILLENNGTVQYVKAPQLVTGKFQAQKLVATKIVTKSFGDGVNPVSFLNSFILKSHDVRINGGLVFTNLVKVSSLNSTTINGVPISNIARYSQDNLFECPVQFINGFNVSGNVVTPTINGISVVDEVMLASNISGVNFLDGFVIANNTNSKGGDYSFDKVLLKSTSQVVQSQIHFQQLRIISPLEVTNIDKYDVDAFLSSVVTKDYTGLISGRKTVADTVHTNTLHIGSTWNNVSFPIGFIHNNQKRVALNLPTSLSFLTVKKVTLGGSTLNGVNLDDLVTRNTKQVLNSSTWTFLGPVTVNKDIVVSGLVDGVDMKELGNKDTLNDYRDVHIYADVELPHDISIDNLRVMNTINGQDFEPIFQDFVQFNGTHCQIPGVTTVLTNVTLDTLNVEDGSINGQQLSNFFLVNGDQNITEDVTLSESCNFTSLYALKSFDNVDLATLLDNAVRLTGSNTIKWKTAFEHIKCGDDGMIIDGPINGFSDFGSNVAVTSGRPSQTFLSPIEFEIVNFDFAVVERDFNVAENQKVGGLDIRKWYSKRISLSKLDYITSPVIIDGTVTALHDIFTPTINNVSLEALATSAFRTGVPEQTFSKHVTFLNGLKVVYGSIKFDGPVSGYDLNHIRQNAFPLNSSDYRTLELNGVWQFENIVVEKLLQVEGETCGVNLKDFESTTVRKDTLDIQIPGQSHFHNATVEKLVQVGSINGRNPDDLLTTHTNQTIHCNFEAKKNVKIIGNLITDGHVNGVSTEMLSKTYSLGKNNTHIINADYKFNHNLTTERLIVRGTIQGKDFSNTTNNRHLIKVNDIGLKFTGLKTFTSAVTISKDSFVKLYNNLPLETLSFQSLDQDIIIPAASISFHGPVKARTVQIINDEKGEGGGGEVEGFNINADMVMGYKWDDILANSIPLDGDVDPEHLRNLIFDSVVVDRHLNTKIFQGHRFEDFIRLDSDKNMGELKVRKVKITGTTLTVGGLVNGFNIGEEFEQTVMKDGDNDGLESNSSLELSGKKTFLGTITVEGDVTCFGPSFADNVIDIRKPFTISHSLEFSSPLVVEKGLNVSKLVQNTTVEEIMEDALTKGDDNQIITGEWEFTNGLTFMDDVLGPGELKNFDLTSLINNTEYAVRAAGDKIQSQRLQFKQECRKVKNVTNDILYNPMKLDAFDKHQSITLRQQAKKIVIVKSSQRMTMLTSNHGCLLTKYEWKKNSELFYRDDTSEHGTLDFGQIKDWQSTIHDRDGLLVFSTESSTCSSSGLLSQQGLHVSVMNGSGVFSRTQTLHLGEVKTFRLISSKDGKHTAVFVINKDTLDIFTWNSHNGKFFKMEQKLGSSAYDGLDVTIHQSGFAVLLTGPTEISIWQFSWNRQDLSLLAKERFLSNQNNNNPIIFDSFGLLYALVLREGSQISTSPTFSTTQVFSLVGTHLIKLQQIPLSDAHHKTVINFSHQIFVGFLSKSYGLNIYKFQGLSGLQRLNENPIKIFNGEGMVSFDVKAWDFSAPRPFIAVLTSQTIEIFHSNVYGDSLDYSALHMCSVD